MSEKETGKVTNWITGSMLGAEYTQDMKIAQMHEWINVAFHVRTKIGRYTENMKCETNVALDRKHEMIGRKHEIFDRSNQKKIKHDDFSIIGGKWMWVRNSNRIGVPDLTRDSGRRKITWSIFLIVPHPLIFLLLRIAGSLLNNISRNFHTGIAQQKS